jgi:hypothetical protein
VGLLVLGAAQVRVRHHPDDGAPGLQTLRKTLSRNNFNR